MYLNANNNAAVLDELGERSPIICALVECFMEKDDASDAAVNALVGCEEQLAVAAPVLLCVFNPYGVQTFRHAACRQHTYIHRYMHWLKLRRSQVWTCLTNNVY